jgi:hypothetical protein
MRSRKATLAGLKGPFLAGGGLFAAWLGLMAMPKCDRSEPPPRHDAWDAPAATATATRAEYVKTVEPQAPPAPQKLKDLIALTKPVFVDTDNEIDRTGVFFGLAWATMRYPWSELAALPETSFGKFKKDPSAERGKRLCATGLVGEITDATAGGTVGDLPARSLYGGKMAEGTNVITFYAVGSTGGIVQGNTARFCGVATGIYSFPNSLGTTTHSVLASGMFDLPENRKALSAPMPKR